MLSVGKMWKVCERSCVNPAATLLVSFPLRFSTRAGVQGEKLPRHLLVPPNASLVRKLICSQGSGRSFSSSTKTFSKGDSVRSLFTSTSKSNFPEVATADTEWEAFPIPGTSAAAEAAGLRQGTVVGRRNLVENAVLYREELRSGNLRRSDASLVPMGAMGNPAGTQSGSRISSEEIGRIAEEFLGPSRFSTSFSLSSNFGHFREIILLFLFKVAQADHPVTQLTKILEREPHEGLGGGEKNPYPLWRAMMVLLTAEMCGLPQELARVPKDVHSAIREKHDILGKIVEVVWIAHQLHRRILDVSNVPAKRLKSVSVGGHLLQTEEDLDLADDLHRANKATTLVGDLLLTQKCVYLAALQSPIVTELICNSLADYCESEFDLGVISTSPEYFTYEAWLNRCELGLGSLLGHCMYSALLFSGFDGPTRQRAFKLGSVLGVLNMAYQDVHFLYQKDTVGWVDLGILPLVFQYERDPGLLSNSHEEIFKALVSTPSTVEQSVETFLYIQRHALGILETFDDISNPTAREILMNYIRSLCPWEDRNR